MGFTNAFIAIITLIVIVVILLNPLYNLLDNLTTIKNQTDTIEQKGTNYETGEIEVVSTGIPFMTETIFLFSGVGFFLTLGVVLYLIRFAPNTYPPQQPGYPPQYGSGIR
jgi:hypothetical protein